MKSTAFAALLLLAVALCPALVVAAPISFSPGDVLVNSLNAVVQYRANGVEVLRFGSTGKNERVYEGATIIRGRRIATTRRLPVPGVVLIEANGFTTFDTPAVQIPGDISVFADGTLAISDQGGGIDLYSTSSAFVASISHPSLSAGTPFGSAIGPDDTLWIATLGSELLHFNRLGAYLGSVPTGFSTSELAIDHIDGTLWTSSSGGVVHQFATDGTHLSSFRTVVSGVTTAIAIAPDRTLYVSSLDSPQVFHYDRTGVLLNSFVHNNGRPVFINVAFVPEPSALALMPPVLAAAAWRRKQVNAEATGVGN